MSGQVYMGDETLFEAVPRLEMAALLLGLDADVVDGLLHTNLMELPNLKLGEFWPTTFDYTALVCYLGHPGPTGALARCGLRMFEERDRFLKPDGAVRSTSHGILWATACRLSKPDVLQAFADCYPNSAPQP